MSPEISEACTILQQQMADLPARFAKQADLHVTLVPPLAVTDHRLVEQTIQDVISGTGSFTLQLKKLDFGPTPKNPRLAWIECEPTNALTGLRKDLVDAFDYKDRYSFRPHVTLARFKDRDRHLLRGRSIEKELDLSMDVTGVVLYESVHKAGVTYKIIASHSF